MQVFLVALELELLLFQSVRGIGQKLSQENLAVSVQGLCDDVQ